MTRRRKRKIIICALILAVIAVAPMIVCDSMVDYAAKDRLYDKLEDVPHRKVGLVLGTSPISMWNGRRNIYFDRRIDAAAQLYNAGKVDWLVVSGGDYRNSENGYDEPVAMRDSLMKQGVDSARIILDYDGPRTLNSIVKMRDVYRQDSIIIISQRYHNERALYQAKHLGIDAVGFNAGTPVGMRSPIWWKNRGREVLARMKLMVDFISKPKVIYKDTVNVLGERIAYVDSCWNPLFCCYMPYPADYYYGIPKGEEKYEDVSMVGHFFSKTRLDSLWIDDNYNFVEEKLATKCNQLWGNDSIAARDWYFENRDKYFEKYYRIYLCSSHPRYNKIILAYHPPRGFSFELMWEGDLDGDGITDFGLFPMGRVNSQWNSYLVMTFKGGKLFHITGKTPSTDFEFRASGMEVAEPGSSPGFIKLNCVEGMFIKPTEYPKKLTPFEPWL